MVLQLVNSNGHKMICESYPRINFADVKGDEWRRDYSMGARVRYNPVNHQN